MWQKTIPKEPGYYWIFEPYSEGPLFSIVNAVASQDTDPRPDIFYTGDECPMGKPWPSSRWEYLKTDGRCYVWWWDQPIARPWLPPPQKEERNA